MWHLHAGFPLGAYTEMPAPAPLTGPASASCDSMHRQQTPARLAAPRGLGPRQQAVLTTAAPRHPRALSHRRRSSWTRRAPDLGGGAFVVEPPLHGVRMARLEARARPASSRTILWKFFKRRGSKSPCAMACEIAQPGSPSWVQSRKRQLVASRVRSGNPESTFAVSVDTGRSWRMPGVSMSSQPSPCAISCREVVVCRPPWSPSRTACSCRCWSRSAFTRVDLPTPEEPTKATVTPGDRRARSSSRPAAERALASSTGVDPAMAAASARAASGSGWRSVLLSTSTSSAPVICHAAPGSAPAG